MRFKVPQNIDMQDRILGPLTMLQFIYAVVGGGITYILFMSVPYPVGAFLAALSAIFTLAIIFLKINERPFSHFLLSFFKFMTTPRERVWHKGGATDLNVEIYHAQNKNTGARVAEKHISREQITRAAQSFDTPNPSR